MQKIFPDSEPILIKTYCYESGLWYLAKSLGDELIKQGHKVYYLPKSKYQLLSGSFTRTYLQPKNIDDFKDNHILEVRASDTIDKQISIYLTKYKIKHLICFESLMEKAGWISNIKKNFKNKVNIIDVPMPEWVNPKFLVNKAYQIFDEIWTLNNLSAGIFKDYKNAKMVSWDIVDRHIFNLNNYSRNYNSINFLHLGSTNPDYSSKNTELTVTVFVDFLNDFHPTVQCNLHIRGEMPIKYKYLEFQSQYGAISNNSEILDRKQLVKLYNSNDAILAPSSREGLSLCLYEGQAAGCKILTTDSKPMNDIKTPYLCKVENYTKEGNSPVLHANINFKNLTANINQLYMDIKSERNF